MSDICFQALKLVNFKGIDSLKFLFDDADAIILGGKNGYGKTTIFDALELVLTGRVERYKDYKDEYTNKKLHRDNNDKPLVCRMDVPIVEVSLYINLKNDKGFENLILTRKANTSDMDNPVDFSVFNNLYIRSSEEDDLRVADDADLQATGLDYLKINYQALNYVGQEECTRFLKCKDGDRAEEVSELFNTSYFDRRIEKIERFGLQILKDRLTEYNRKKERVERVISEVQNYGISEETSTNQYAKLFEGGVLFAWDGETPVLSNEDFAGLLSEGGELDRIQWFLEKYADYSRYNKSLFISRILESVDDYAFYLQYSEKKETIGLYNNYLQKTVNPIQQLTVERIQDYVFAVDSWVTEALSGELIAKIEERVAQCKKTHNIASLAGKVYNTLLEERGKLAKHLQEHAKQLDITTCPICGRSFVETEELLDAVNETLQLHFSAISVFAGQVTESYQQLKDVLSEAVSVANAWFAAKGVTAEVAKRFSKLDSVHIEKDITVMTKREVISQTFKGESVEQTKQMLREALLSWSEQFDKSLDYRALEQINNTYVRFIRKEYRSQEAINQKRSYLTACWTKQKARQLDEMTKEKVNLENAVKNCNELIEKVKKIKKQIVDQRDQYLKKVTSDIEILFYIYSGRIMQDSFYGRGLFMKLEPRKYVYFVTKYKSDVDALYNMSSGQLVALVLAFTLSLNKLYSKTKFIAIDDPVQTIDDLNVWGFVETLRHEFNDSKILLSTHELNHGAFLRNKLGNFGFSAQYRDMMQERIK